MKRIARFKVLLSLSQISSLISVATLAWAEPIETKLPIPIQSDRKVIENKNCSLDPSCELERITFETTQYKIWIIDRYHYGTKLIAKYQTREVSQLENFVFVSHVRGCSYESRRSYDPPYDITVYYPWVWRQFGTHQRTKFPEWRIDSVDLDPVYNSLEDYPDQRHYAYRWNEIPGSTDKKTEKYYGIEKPKTPELYVQVLPSSVWASEPKYVTFHSSFDWKMCLYREKDIPKVANYDTPLPQPIYCHDWRTYWDYDWMKQTHFISKKMNPVCEVSP